MPSVWDHYLGGLRNARGHIVRASHERCIPLAHDDQGRDAYVRQAVDHPRIDLGQNTPRRFGQPEGRTLRADTDLGATPERGEPLRTPSRVTYGIMYLFEIIRIYRSRSGELEKLYSGF